MQIRDDCPLYPGMCRSLSQAGPIIDTEIDDAIGRLYLSVPRVVEPAARLAGFVARDEYDQAIEDTARLRQHVAELEQQLEEARAAQVKVVPVSELAALVSESRGGE